MNTAVVDRPQTGRVESPARRRRRGGRRTPLVSYRSRADPSALTTKTSAAYRRTPRPGPQPQCCERRAACGCRTRRRRRDRARSGARRPPGRAALDDEARLLALMGKHLRPRLRARPVALVEHLQRPAIEVRSDLPVGDRAARDLDELMGAIDHLLGRASASAKDSATPTSSAESTCRRADTEGLTLSASIIEIVAFETPARRASSRCDRPRPMRSRLSLGPMRKTSAALFMRSEFRTERTARQLDKTKKTANVQETGRLRRSPSPVYGRGLG